MEIKGRKKNGNLFVISAPSGAGKTTLCRVVMDTISGIGYSISHTTRKPRHGESHGQDYYFISKEEFEKMIADDALVEWAEVHGNYYGTSLGFINESIDAGRDILMDVDVQGASQILKRYSEAVTIFIMPPSMEVLRERLSSRASDDTDVIEERIRNAAEEIAMKDSYRHLIVNDRLETAIDEILSLIRQYQG